MHFCPSLVTELMLAAMSTPAAGESLRDALRESAYEAAAALGGTAGVVAILADHVM